VVEDASEVVVVETEAFLAASFESSAFAVSLEEDLAVEAAVRFVTMVKGIFALWKEV